MARTQPAHARGARRRRVASAARGARRRARVERRLRRLHSHGGDRDRGGDAGAPRAAPRRGIPSLPRGPRPPDPHDRRPAAAMGLSGNGHAARGRGAARGVRERAGGPLRRGPRSRGRDGRDRRPASARRPCSRSGLRAALLWHAWRGLDGPELRALARRGEGLGPGALDRGGVTGERRARRVRDDDPRGRARPRCEGSSPRGARLGPGASGLRATTSPSDSRGCAGWTHASRRTMASCRRTPRSWRRAGRSRCSAAASSSTAPASRVRSGAASRPDVASAAGPPRELLAAAVALVVEGPDAARLAWTHDGPKLTRQAEGAAEWQATSRAGAAHALVHGRIELDGTIEYEVALRADAAVELGDVRLELPLRDEVARYVMGLGWKGGRRPDRLDWTWDVAKKNQDAVVDRRRERRPPAHAQGRALRAAAQHELLPHEAARAARLVGQRREGQLPARGRGRCRISSAAGAARDGWRRARRCASTSASCSRRSSRSTPRRSGATRFFHRYAPLDGDRRRRRQHGERPPRDADQPVDQLPVPAPGADEGLRRRGARARHEGEDLLHGPRALEPRTRSCSRCARSGTRCSRAARAAAAPGCRSTWAATTSPGWFVPEIKDAALVNSGHLALAQLLRRGPRLARAERGHRRPLPRRRGLRPHDDEARAQGARPAAPRRAHRPALRQPVQRARRLRVEREPLPRALPVHRPAVVRRVLRLRRAARLLAGRDLGHPVRPDGRDAREGRQPLARDAVRHDEPPAVGRRPAAAVEGVGRVRPRGQRA